eukprot:scaffold11829_cov95-Isochrysis_galbana.AAC.2
MAGLAVDQKSARGRGVSDAEERARGVEGKGGRGRRVQPHLYQRRPFHLHRRLGGRFPLPAPPLPSALFPLPLLAGIRRRRVPLSPVVLAPRLRAVPPEVPLPATIIALWQLLIERRRGRPLATVGRLGALAAGVACPRDGVVAAFVALEAAHVVRAEALVAAETPAEAPNDLGALDFRRRPPGWGVARRPGRSVTLPARALALGCLRICTRC